MRNSAAPPPSSLRELFMESPVCLADLLTGHEPTGAPERPGLGSVHVLCLALAMTWPDRVQAAETFMLAPVADTALLEYFPTNNFGGQTWLNAGTTQNYTKNRGLLKFDIAGRLPARARIISAALTLHVTRSPVACLSFVLEPGEPCAVEFCDEPAHAGTGSWIALSRIPALTTRTNVVLGDPLGDTQRYYRLRFE